VSATTSTPTKKVMSSGGYRRYQVYFWIVAALVLIATVRTITGAHDLDSQGAIRAAIVATCPILLAALGGLWSERAGVVNIGLEGQMLLGTWGAAFFTYWYNPYLGLLGGVVMGILGGVLHGLATITFGVDHIVSGVALNVIALGLITFLAEAFFTNLNSEFGRGGARQLQGLAKPVELEGIPGVSDTLKAVGEQHIWFVSDAANVLGALVSRVSVVTILVLALVPLTWWLLWRTSFGLRLRSCGENPAAAESLGVNVMAHKYVAVLVSGGLAGLGGAYLVAGSGFVTGQTAGRGYIGLAAMIFGNWRPLGALTGSAMFGYTDMLTFREESTIHALLLLVAIGLAIFAIIKWRGGLVKAASWSGAAAIAFLAWYLLVDSVPREFASMTPYVLTLLVLTFAAQQLRMPKADGQIYRKGAVG
jgi:general nucleoside transport system permease protein